MLVYTTLNKLIRMWCVLNQVVLKRLSVYVSLAIKPFTKNIAFFPTPMWHGHTAYRLVMYEYSVHVMAVWAHYSDIAIEINNYEHRELSDLTYCTQINVFINC